MGSPPGQAGPHPGKLQFLKTAGHLLTLASDSHPFTRNVNLAEGSQRRLVVVSPADSRLRVERLAAGLRCYAARERHHWADRLVRTARIRRHLAETYPRAVKLIQFGDLLRGGIPNAGHLIVVDVEGRQAATLSRFEVEDGPPGPASGWTASRSPRPEARHPAWRGSWHWHARMQGPAQCPERGAPRIQSCAASNSASFSRAAAHDPTATVRTTIEAFS